MSESGKTCSRKEASGSLAAPVFRTAPFAGDLAGFEKMSQSAIQILANYLHVNAPKERNFSHSSRKTV